MKPKPDRGVRVQRLVGLRRDWLRQSKQYRFGKNWMFNDPESKRVREAKAEVLEDCVSDLRVVMLKAG